MNSSKANDIDAAIQVSRTQRTPCVLVLDTSGSMMGDDRIGQLNRALKSFEATIKKDGALRQQVVLSVIGFGSEVSILTDWVQADEFVAPVLVATGQTVLGQAMRRAHAAIEDLRVKLKAEGIAYTRPWIFLMSDGQPTDDDWKEAAEESRQRCESKRAAVWPFAVSGADAKALQSFARHDMDVYSLEGADFDAIFRWLTTSLGAVASSTGTHLQIAPPPLIRISV
jgi:uncharacterized protein YegL